MIVSRIRDQRGLLGFPGLTKTDAFEEITDFKSVIFFDQVKEKDLYYSFLKLHLTKENIMGRQGNSRLS
jgi:hypothetical protein